MKKLLKTFLCLLCAIALGATFAACGPTAAEVTGVTLDKTQLYLTAGGTATLTATVEPDNAADKTLSWSSSDTTVATVNAGMVTAVKSGTAVITVTANSGQKSATCTVTVLEAKLTEEQWKKTVADTLSAENFTIKVVQEMGEDKIETEAKFDKAGGKIWNKGEPGVNWSERYIVKGADEITDYTLDKESGKWNVSSGELDSFNDMLQFWEGIGDGVKETTVDFIPMVKYDDIAFENDAYSFCFSMEDEGIPEINFLVTVGGGYMTKIIATIELEANGEEAPATVTATFTLSNFGTTQITLPADLPH